MAPMAFIGIKRKSLNRECIIYKSNAFLYLNFALIKYIL